MTPFLTHWRKMTDEIEVDASIIHLITISLPYSLYLSKPDIDCVQKPVFFLLFLR